VISSAHPETRHIIVSGGSRGLGQNIVRRLLDAQYSVSTFSRSATEFISQLRDYERFFFSQADISDVSSTRAFLKSAEAKLGSPYGLVNCAGIAVDGLLATTSDESIEKVLSVNLKGTLQMTKLVVRRMLIRRQGGVIVNMSSIVAIRGYRGLVAYAATKGGMDAMTRALARELGERRIRVNSVAPGYIATEMTHGLDDHQRQQIIHRTPLGRLGTVEDVVGPVLFLLSDEAQFVTGQVLVVDGGISC
jgi:3-oxoacyl-[acyl-carrier protein] reductase